jgi:surface antigen
LSLSLLLTSRLEQYFSPYSFCLLTKMGYTAMRASVQKVLPSVLYMCPAGSGLTACPAQEVLYDGAGPDKGRPDSHQSIPSRQKTQGAFACLLPDALRPFDGQQRQEGPALLHRRAGQKKDRYMRRFILAAFLVTSFVAMFAIPQTAQASSLHQQSSASSHVLIHPDSNLSSSTTYANRYPWGQCTWWAAQSKLTENLESLGNAYLWATNAHRRGISIGSTPRVGATAVFGPWVQGAGSLGHVAHVIAVSGKRFEVSEMNFYGGTPRGGFGRVDYRWATAGSGVTFIY